MGRKAVVAGHVPRRRRLRGAGRIADAHDQFVKTVKDLSLHGVGPLRAADDEILSTKHDNYGSMIFYRLFLSMRRREE
jgi:hypothetical protein